MTDPATLGLLAARHTLRGRGKSQELFVPYIRQRDLLVSFLTNRLSSHDFPLGFEIPRANEVQHVLTVFWKRMLKANGSIPTDLVAVGPYIDRFLHPELQGNPEVWKVTSVSRVLVMDKLEIIPRIDLTGSAWRQYQEQEGMVYGRQLPPGMLQNDPLDGIIVTYTDKAPPGEHDHPLNSQEVEAMHPHLTPIAHEAMGIIKYHNWSQDRARVADTKLEGGRDASGVWRIGDQVGTPFTSRIWALPDIARTPRGSRIPPHDKDIVRWEMEGMGIKKFDPGDPLDCEAVLDLVPTPYFINQVSELFLEAVPLLTGMTLKQAQCDVLDIPKKYL